MFGLLSWLKSCWRKNFPELVSLGVVLIVYIGCLSISPHKVFWSPDEGARFLMANSLTSGLDKTSNKGYAGINSDPEFRFYPGHYKYSGFLYPIPQDDGTFKYPWTIGFPFVSGLVYQIFGIHGIYLIPLLSGWLIALIIWQFSNILSPSLSLWAILLAGLGTPIFFYSQVFWDHTLASLMGLVALYSLTVKPKLSFSSTTLVVLPLAIAISLRIEMFAFALAMGFAWVVSKRRVSTRVDFPSHNSMELPTRRITLPQINNPRKVIQYLLISIVLIILLGLLLYFSLPIRYVGEFSRLSKEFLTHEKFFLSSRDFLIRNINALPDLLINTAASEGLQLSPQLAWIGIVAVLLSLPTVRVRSMNIISLLLIFTSIVMLTIISIATFSTQTYRSLHGFFICAPYALICAYGLNKAWQRRRYQELVVYLSSVFYLLIGIAIILVFRAGKEVKTWPGLEWGQRYLLTLYPLLALLSLIALRDFWKLRSPKFLRMIVIGLTIILMVMSFFIQVRGVWMLRESRQTITSWINNLEFHQSDPVITDEWWLPASIATFFTTHEMYSFVESDDFSLWLTQIGSDGVDNFTYISSSPIDLSSISNLQNPIQPTSTEDIGGLSFTRYSIIQDNPKE
jgi:hypothetical protein